MRTCSFHGQNTATENSINETIIFSDKAMTAGGADFNVEVVETKRSKKKLQVHGNS